MGGGWTRSGRTPPGGQVNVQRGILPCNRHIGRHVDYFQKLTALILLGVSLPALAAFPAEPTRNGWYVPTSSTSDTPFNGVWHESPELAANHACQKAFGSASTFQRHEPQPGGTNGAGLNDVGKFYNRVFCNYNGGVHEVARGVRNMADCKGTGQPIINYAPATCSGDPPSTSASTSEQCAMTAGVVIPGYVKTDTPVSLACYSGCQYTPTVTSMDTIDGITYQDGGWKGNGKVCSGSEAIAGGGSANGANGITAGDLARLNQEITQKQVLAVLNQILAKTGTAASSTSNPQIDVTNAKLEEIRAADQTAREDRSDPDALEAAQQDAITANPVNAFDGVPSSTVDVGGTFSAQNGFLSGQCPQPPSFTVRGETYSYDITPICSMAEMLSFLVIAFATVVGVRIFIGGNS
jgi:hypothetical protein